MKCVVFSDDILLCYRWESILENKDIEIIEDMMELKSVQNSVVLFNYSKNQVKSEGLVSLLVSNNNLVIVLDRIPTLNSARKYLALGAKGYGNVIMATPYILSSIESIQEGKIWLLPDISTQFVKNIETIVDVSVGLKNRTEIQNSIYNQLTHKEESVAKLIKDGLTNSEISEALDISGNTLKTHVKNIYKKLNVKDRMGFAMLWTKKI